MSCHWQTMGRGRLVLSVGAALAGTWLVTCARFGVAQQERPPAPQQAGEAADAQAYVGTQKCAACHFQAYRQWQQTPHAKAFSIMPAPYRNNAGCLECHATGFGHPTGYQGQATPHLASVSCEACHGPGGEHFQLASSFLGKEITEADEKRIQASIELLRTNVCLECHVTAMHKPHPPYQP
jgi:mono/diheme cytochrome c family protein